MTAEHELKTLARFFDAVWSGTKTFEVRYDDRGYEVGDTLVLREMDDLAQEYTGRWLTSTVTYIFAAESNILALKPGWVVMGLKPGIAGSHWDWQRGETS